MPADIWLFGAELRDPLLPLWAMELLAKAFLWAWLFCLGATVGSFLNVVVYRVPRGLNIVFPGSFCPHCGHAVRGYDNIPLVSWLALRGRCRDCGGPISARYFLIELAVAVTFLLVLIAEHFLPAGSLGFATRHLLSVRDGVPFWCMYFLHAGLVTTILGAVLIRAGGHDVPAGLFVPVLIAGLVLPVVWPEVRSVPAIADAEIRGWRAGLIDGLAGGAAGLAIGAALAPLAVRAGWDVMAVLGLSCCVGLIVGWQRSMYVVPMTWLLCWSAGYLIGRRGRHSDIATSSAGDTAGNEMETPGASAKRISDAEETTETNTKTESSSKPTS